MFVNDWNFRGNIGNIRVQNIWCPGLHVLCPVHGDLSADLSSTNYLILSCPVRVVLSRCSVLSRRSCFACPVPSVLSRLSCPVCSVKAVLPQLSWTGCPVLSWLSCPGYPAAVAVNRLSCPLLAVLSRLSCPLCPTVLSPLSYCPVPDVPSRLSCPVCPVPSVLSRRSCPGWFVHSSTDAAVRSLLACSGRYSTSCPGSPAEAELSGRPSKLTCSGFLVLVVLF